MNMETYTPAKYSDKELLEIFPEAKEIIPKKIKEWERISESNKNDLKDCLVFIYSQKLDEFSIWFSEQVARLFLMPPILEANRHILRLKMMLPIFNPSRGSLKRWQEKMEQARQYPITELARSKLDLKSAGSNFFTLCPFHNEKHASFYIYSKTNTFHCFGCSENGDVIKLTMHLYGLDFKEAIQMLQD